MDLFMLVNRLYLLQGVVVLHLAVVLVRMPTCIVFLLYTGLRLTQIVIRLEAPLIHRSKLEFVILGHERCRIGLSGAPTSTDGIYDITALLMGILLTGAHVANRSEVIALLPSFFWDATRRWLLLLLALRALPFTSKHRCLHSRVGQRLTGR